MSLSEVKFAIPAKKPIIESIRSGMSPDSCCTGFGGGRIFVVFVNWVINQKCYMLHWTKRQSTLTEATTMQTCTIQKNKTHSNVVDHSE